MQRWPRTNIGAGPSVVPDAWRVANGVVALLLDVQRQLLLRGEVCVHTGVVSLVCRPVRLDVTLCLVVCGHGGALLGLRLEREPCGADEDEGSQGDEPDVLDVALVVTNQHEHQKSDGNEAGQNDGALAQATPAP